jgi:hypothetical protein
MIKKLIKRGIFFSEIVKTYNRILKEKIQKETDFVWLDFFDTLLTPDGENLNPEYELDGTHLCPKYVQHISECLEHVQFLSTPTNNTNTNNNNNNNNNNNQF